MTDKSATRTGPTALLDFDHPAIAALIAGRGWRDLAPYDRIGAIYGFVRDEIAFGYNRDDAIPASEVLADGYGQCNTKAVLLMALLRGAGMDCRLRGFTIHKALQRGVVPEWAWQLAPDSILHSWVEVAHDGNWRALEGFILDRPYLAALQRRFAGQGQGLCGYGAGTDCLSAPPVDWQGGDTYIQREGINADLGLFDTPDEFFAGHRQSLGPLRAALYRHLVRHLMNARVRRIRAGVPGMLPDLPAHGHGREPARL